MSKKKQAKKQLNFGDMFGLPAEKSSPKKKAGSQVIESKPKLYASKIASETKKKEYIREHGFALDEMEKTHRVLKLPDRFDHLVDKAEIIIKDGGSIVFPEVIREDDIWFCPRCRDFFEGPPITVNFDPLKRDLYLQYRCTKCLSAPCSRTFKKSINDDMEWEGPIRQSNFKCTKCKATTLGYRHIVEDDGAVIREYYCRACRLIHDRQFIGYTKDLDIPSKGETT
jgi:hypothetical protein